MKLPPAKLLLFLLVALAVPAVLSAQPSGGPYGPVAQTYVVPKDALHVYYVAPDGKADAPGTTLEAPTTLEAAIERVVTGDAIILRGGVYRTGGLRLNQGITLQPYADEHPVLKGTEVATQWEALRGNVWRTSWKKLFPAKPQDWWRREREGMLTPVHRFNNDMVFVDGESLLSAGWEGELDVHKFFIDYEHGYVYIGVDPTNRLVEITAFDNALVRTTAAVYGKTNDHKGPVIRGLTFTQYAFRALEVEGKRRGVGANEEPTDDPIGPADPATYGKEVVGTTLENVTITFCSRVAGYFRGDKLTIRNSLVSDTSTEGIYVIGSSDVLLERNIVRRNNVEGITGYYPSAVKIFNQCHRVTCRDNLVLEQPRSNGIWYDVGNVAGVVVNNWVQDALDGIFVEISKGAVVAGNVLVNCEHGIRALNSSDVHAYQNTLVNSMALFERNPRVAENDGFGWHAATGPDLGGRHGHVFVGNLLVADEGYRRPLLNVDQTDKLCGRLTDSQLTRLDGNVYVRRAESVARPVIVWGPVAEAKAGEKCSIELATPSALNKLMPQFEGSSRLVDGYFGALFKSAELSNLEVVGPLPKTGTVDPVPPEVRALMGWKPNPARLPGAYPGR